MDIPNLDNCLGDELKGHRLTFLALARYCELQQEAIRARCDGLITVAQSYEAECQKVYNSLPHEARW